LEVIGDAEFGDVEFAETDVWGLGEFLVYWGNDVEVIYISISVIVSEEGMGDTYT
jgi:hypothetical protein